MTKQWLSVVLAGLIEVLWVIGLKHANNTLEWAGTIICILLSFYLMLQASKHMPVGTVYAVFVGIGSTGTVIVDMLFFGEPFKLAKVALIAVLLLGVIGLKLVTGDKQTEEGA
ncbi:DMT family transporter [Terribacillus saccharophilus]|uniref:Multidrug resistance protein SMR n=1 Tax=Terribacillus saccharophilus TaxID=361277 RepID=A0A075LID0_9BACI|nr:MULTISPECIES: multidrug efflux SMR transporter [Terribacillus]AIF66164.1 multidrug resistance protein SMR [Terribacillus goriensis]MCM3225153.1 multidrug efflux SMR transporter [Terribacillus saccharophilus]MEC0281337.1 multidrug efflux SMR transporter [Terribacillus saccharophilus]MEC0289537.1 multidrug efflux SMR transporter [Terribacillus saccharophilus]SEM82738.1 paired small multidrug resistance pump [Terribacillus saccharophilus]